MIGPGADTVHPDGRVHAPGFVPGYPIEMVLDPIRDMGRTVPSIGRDGDGCAVSPDVEEFDVAHVGRRVVVHPLQRAAEGRPIEITGNPDVEGDDAVRRLVADGHALDGHRVRPIGLWFGTAPGRGGDIGRRPDAYPGGHDDHSHGQDSDENDPEVEFLHGC